MNERTYETANGAVLTDDDIEELADEAEAGYDPVQLLNRGGRPLIGSGPAAVIPVRLDPDLQDDLEQAVAREQTTRSDVIRKALHEYLERHPA